MENNNLELRMYSLVMYNISPIQQGIQAGHATNEYLNHHGYDNEDFKNWNQNYKTVILLNGGSSITMAGHLETLVNRNILVSYFHEPDLNGSLSAISFIVDERVFDKKKYPDFDDRLYQVKAAEDLKTFYITTQQYELAARMRDNEKKILAENLEAYPKWVESIGGTQNVWLREFLKNFRLA